MTAKDGALQYLQKAGKRLPWDVKRYFIEHWGMDPDNPYISHMTHVPKTTIYFELLALSQQGDVDLLVERLKADLDSNVFSVTDALGILDKGSEAIKTDPRVICFLEDNSCLFEARPIKVDTTMKHSTSFKEFVDEEAFCQEGKESLLECAENFCNLYSAECEGITSSILAERYLGDQGDL